MSPTRKAGRPERPKRRRSARPAPRAGKVRAKRARAAARGTRANVTWYALTALLVIVGVMMVVVLRPSRAASVGIKLGEHWHAALGVYACDHWDGSGSWPTPTDPASHAPARAGGGGYAGLHSHNDGLIHMEPQSSDEIGTNANLGTYVNFNGFELSATHVKFVTADLNNGDKCGNASGKLHWLVDGTERIGNPANYVLHNNDWIVVAFLADTKKITSLGKLPSFANLASQGPPPT